MFLTEQEDRLFIFPKAGLFLQQGQSPVITFPTQDGFEKPTSLHSTVCYKNIGHIFPEFIFETLILIV